MKKLMSLFLIIMVMLVSVAGSSFPVLAANSEENDKDDDQPVDVMYGAIVKSNGISGQYRSIYAIRQAMFKPNNNPDERPSFLSGKKSVYSTLCYQEEHDKPTWTEQNIVSELCNGYKFLNSPLASFSVNVNSDLLITLSADVRIKKLNIYYSIAGLSASNNTKTILLYCANKPICDRAKVVSSANSSVSGNWVSDSKHDKNMTFQESELERYGFNMTTNTTGAKTYSGFNIVENMDRTARNLALDNGAYVIVTMSVIHTTEDREVEYHINTPITAMADRPEFEGIAHITTETQGRDIKTYANVASNPQRNDADGDQWYRSRMSDMGMTVDKHAALVHKLASQTEEDKAIRETIEMFNRIIRPIIMIALGILLVVRGTMLVMTIIKSSDEPEVRRESIKHLVGLFISVFVIMMIIWFLEDIVEIMQELLNEGK